MYFKQFYLGCLAHASYLVGSEGEAAVVDPQRDVDQYIAEAEAHGLKIKYVVETHLHADFVSGHCELAARTGAEIVFGRAARATFPHRAVADGDEIRVGKVILRFVETPGHVVLKRRGGIKIPRAGEIRYNPPSEPARARSPPPLPSPSTILHPSGVMRCTSNSSTSAVSRTPPTSSAPTARPRS